MPVDVSIADYHRSIAQELENTRDRVRNLIGQSHWLTDGEHKESILRKVLHNHLPETVRVGTGFVCFGDGTATTQQDILLTDRSKPTLFKEGDLTIVTADAVEAVIEVKTRIASRSELLEILSKLASSAEKIRRGCPNRPCWAGLFAYKSSPFRHRALLEVLQEVSEGITERAVDCVVLGSDTIARFLPAGTGQQPDKGDVWYSYCHRGLAQAYFISYVVWRLTEDMPRDLKFAWFPLGTSANKHCYASLYGGEVGEFPMGK